jgi:hypothetical protein
MKSTDDTFQFSQRNLAMRPFLIALLILSASFGPVTAGEKSPPGSITTPSPQSDSDQSTDNCVEVEIDGSKAFDCLNRRLQSTAAHVNPVPNVPPIDARSQDIHIGVVNGPAVQQQYGPNFGQSVVPYRPAAPIFKPPLSPR